MVHMLCGTDDLWLTLNQVSGNLAQDLCLLNINLYSTREP